MRLKTKRNYTQHGLEDLALFANCSARQLKQIDALGVRVTVPQGRQLMGTGERGGDFVVVLAGSATCFVNDQPVARFDRGDFFGEVALLDGGRRTATVVADTDMQVLVLTRDEFDVLVEEVPAAAHRILAALAQRLRAANDLAMAH